MRKLWPPLPLIENELFAPSAALLQRWRDGDAPPELAAALARDPDARSRRAALDWADQQDFAPGDDYPVQPPAALREQFRRRDETRRAAFSPKPTAGQILRLDAVIGPAGPLDWDLPRPLAVLIAEPTATPQVWWGWLVAPASETDYAAFYDVLLGPEDEPCDPLAGMVQLWNPVHVYLPSASRVLAELQPDRLAALRALAAECAATAPPDTILPQPGEILVRQVGAYTVRTGTPYGGAQDPRLRYQRLYFEAAAAVKEPARWAAAARSPLERMLDTLRDWAADVGALWTPYTPAPQRMAGTPGASPWDTVAHYDLDETLRLRLWVDEANRLLHLRLECRADLDLRIQLQEDGETLQTATLRPDAPAVELSADLAKTSELLVSTARGELRYRLPLNPFDA